MKKAEDTLAAATKQKEGATARVNAVVAKEAETKKTIEQAKTELASTQFLQRKWQAAAINLSAHKESENLDDMALKLDDMKQEETVAKQEAEAAAKARAEAETTLANAKKTVAEGTAALQEKSSSVLERALALVASRAVAELREEAIQEKASILDPAATTLASNDSSTIPTDEPVEADATPSSTVEKAKVAAETLAYKSPEEIGNEVASLKNRLSELEQFLASSYVEATKTKTTVTAADQVARETPKVIAERSQAEQQAARELAEAEAERKRQEEALVAQKKRIEELRRNISPPCRSASDPVVPGIPSRQEPPWQHGGFCRSDGIPGRGRPDLPIHFTIEKSGGNLGQLRDPAIRRYPTSHGLHFDDTATSPRRGDIPFLGSDSRAGNGHSVDPGPVVHGSVPSLQIDDRNPQRWHFSAGLTARSIQSHTSLRAPGLKNLGAVLDRRPNRGRGNVGLFKGGADTIVYDDGSVGPEGVLSPPFDDDGTARATVNSASQVSPPTGRRETNAMWTSSN